MSKKIDLRIRRTRKMLRDALVQLIKEKGFDAITVKDIAERAMINRSTFYLHYEDKQDLLLRGMDEIFDELAALAEPLKQDRQGSALNEPPPVLIAVFDHVAENAEFYQVLLGEKGAALFAVRLREYYTKFIGNRIRHILNDNRFTPIVPVEIAISHAASSYSGVITWWLNSGMPFSSESMAKYLVTLNLYGLFQCLGIPVKPYGEENSR